jgi:predicted metal-dependent phosphoesterase TrpH
MGMNISQNELDEITKGGSIGRPHIGQLLLQKGYVDSVAQAFHDYLGRGKPAYVPKEKLKIEAAIDVVHRAGGLAILAHPISLGYDNYPRFGEEILKLQALGLDGIEAYYPSHDRYFTQWLLDFAAQHDLAVSGGSDFHGKAKPDIKPGVGFGNMNIPFSVYEALERRVTKNN